MRLRDLLFQLGLVLGAIVLGKLLDSPAGYVIAAVLAVALIAQWAMQKEDGEEEFKGNSLFAGAIPSGANPSDDMEERPFVEEVVAMGSREYAYQMSHDRRFRDKMNALPRNKYPELPRFETGGVTANSGRLPLCDGDPVVYVSLSNKDSHPLHGAGWTTTKDTDITFENGGQIEALDVHLTFGTMQTGRVSVPVVPRVKAGASAKTRGEIRGPNGEDMATFKMRDIELLLAAEWEQYNDLTKETLDIPCHITYRNPQEQKFLAEAIVRYSAYTKQMEIRDFHFWRV